MSEEKLVCPICGKPTSVYMGNARNDRLCRKHAKDLKEGLIYQCSDCGKWNVTGEVCDCKKRMIEKSVQPIQKVLEDLKQDSANKCIICGESSNNSELCGNCWKSYFKHFDTIDKNYDVSKLRDYYYNLKTYIFRTNFYDKSSLFSSLAKLYAIANILKKIHNKSDLMNKVENDISELKEKKLKLIDSEPKSKTIYGRNFEIQAPNRTYDGHFVASECECKVDNALFNLGLAHVYGKRVSRIGDRSVFCDWYIPVTNTKGIYIELWGVKGDEDYDENKEEKKILYKQYNLPLIEIYPEECTGDDMGLKDRLEAEIRRLSTEISKSDNR